MRKTIDTTLGVIVPVHAPGSVELSRHLPQCDLADPGILFMGIPVRPIDSDRGLWGPVDPKRKPVRYWCPIDGEAMKIYLAQHGEAVSKDIDPDRPLSERGLEDINGIGAQLHTVRVSRVLHSTKTRARQTAQILATTIMPDGQPAVADDINPNDAVEPFAARLAAWTGDTAVVGHLPFMAKLVAYLVTGDGTQQIVSYQPGTIVSLEADEKQIWRIAWMLRPNLVPGRRTAPR